MLPLKFSGREISAIRGAEILKTFLSFGQVVAASLSKIVEAKRLPYAVSPFVFSSAGSNSKTATNFRSRKGCHPLGSTRGASPDKPGDTPDQFNFPTQLHSFQVLHSATAVRSSLVPLPLAGSHLQVLRSVSFRLRTLGRTL